MTNAQDRQKYVILKWQRDLNILYLVVSIYIYIYITIYQFLITLAISFILRFVSF